MTATQPQIPSSRCCLTLAGEIDMANAEEYLAVAWAIIAELDRAIIAGCTIEPGVSVDLSEVTFMDSTGLAMLVGIRKAATDAGMELRLVSVPQRVVRLLDITALADHFGVASAGLS